MCSQGGVLRFKSEKYVVFLSLVWAGPSLLHHPAFMELLLLWSFFHRGEIVQFGAHLLLQCEQFEGKEV